MLTENTGVMRQNTIGKWSIRDHETKTYETKTTILHKTEAETKTNYYETETETKKWFRDNADL